MINKGKYRHFKGNEYEVFGEAKHSETLEDYVLYAPLKGDGQLWIRPKAMFEEEVEVEGLKTPRFVKID